MALAWDVVRHVKSNGVVIVKDGVTRGICAGQTNRVSAVQIAGMRAGERRAGRVTPRPGVFRAALAREGRMNVMAECKRRSPSRAS